MVADNDELLRLSKLIGLIYEGATDPGRWSIDILPAVSEYIQATACTLFTPFNIPRNGGFAYIHGMSQQQLDLYLNRYQAEDIQSQLAVAKGLVFEGNVIIDTDIMPREELLSTRYYNEYLAREDMAQLLTSIVFGPNSASLAPIAAFSFFRGLNNPLFDEQDRKRLHLVLPHISRSLGVMQRIRAAELTVATTLCALDRLPSGVLLIDFSGSVAFANRAAVRMIEDADGLRLCPSTQSTDLNHLVADNAQSSKAIADAISTTIIRDPFATQHFSKCISVPRTSGVANYTLQFSALGQHNEFGAFAAIIFIADGAQEVEIDLELLQSAYQLTSAESRVAVALLNFNSAKEVADAQNISLNTVQTQIKQIYAKLDVNTRARFVKLLLGFARPIS